MGTFCIGQVPVFVGVPPEMEGSHLMSTNVTSKRGHGFLKLVFTLLLAAIVGFGAWFGLSVKRVGDLFGQAATAYEQIKSSVEAQDYDAALTYARTAATLTSQASAELDGVQWDIASQVPVLGTDVATMRSIGTISGTLADDAVVPVLDSWDELAADGIVTGQNVDMGKVSQKMEQLVALAKTLQEAGAVVSDCSSKADALPTSRFEAVNGWTEQLRGAVSSAKTVFEQFGGIVDLVVGVSDMFGSLAG